MSLVHIALKQGKSKEHIKAITDGVCQAMQETYAVPAEDRFITVTQHGDGEFIYSPSYLGVKHTDDLVIIRITANKTRTTAQKRALYRRIAEKLAESPGIKQSDVFISLIEVPQENWSFGDGKAQYVDVLSHQRP